MTATDQLEGKAVITLEEAGRIVGRDPRTVRRWAARWIESGGEEGIPVVQVSERIRLVPVPAFRRWLSAGVDTEPPAASEATPDIPGRCTCVFSWDDKRGP